MYAQPKKLFLLDAYALIFRSYYAFIKNPRITSKGLNTSAIFGFLLTLEEVLQKQKPTHIAVVFDTPAPTFRHEMYSEYKANRDETPEEPGPEEAGAAGDEQPGPAEKVPPPGDPGDRVVDVGGGKRGHDWSL